MEKISWEHCVYKSVDDRDQSWVNVSQKSREKRIHAAKSQRSKKLVINHSFLTSKLNKDEIKSNRK